MKKNKNISSNKRGAKRSKRQKKTASEKYLRRKEFERQKSLIKHKQDKEIEEKNKEIEKIINSRDTSLA